MKNNLNKVKLKLVLILTVSVVLVSCSVFRRTHAYRYGLLTNHLEMWKSFSMSGIIEISYRQLRFRKNIVVSMDDESFKLTILDSGIFGLRTKPFLSVIISDRLTLEAPENLTNLLPGEEIAAYGITVGHLHNGIDTLTQNSKTILNEGFYQDDGVRVQFDNNMQITAVTVARAKEKSEEEQSFTLTMLLDYRSLNQPERIRFYDSGDLLFTINVDRMKAEIADIGDQQCLKLFGYLK